MNKAQPRHKSKHSDFRKKKSEPLVKLKELSLLSEKEQKITHTAECKQGIPTQIIIEFPQSSVGKTVQFRDTDKVQPPKRHQETEEMHF